MRIRLPSVYTTPINQLRLRPSVKNLAREVKNVYTTPINRLRPRPWLSSILPSRPIDPLPAINTNLLTNRTTMTPQQRYLAKALRNKNRKLPRGAGGIYRGAAVNNPQELMSGLSRQKPKTRV